MLEDLGNSKSEKFDATDAPEPRPLGRTLHPSSAKETSRNDSSRIDPSWFESSRVDQPAIERLPGIAPQSQSEATIDRINREMIQLFALVGEGVAGATDSLLSGDRETARVLADSDEMIDMLYREIETLTQSQLVDGSSGLEEMRYLVAVLRMLPELERSGDLAQHVASRAVRGLGTEMSHRARGLVERMGELCSEMWRLTADAYADRSAEHADEVEDLDDDLDHLHVILTAEIASGSMSLPVTIESALVARFYERFGDHAVNLTRRIAALVAPPAAPVEH
jgi:phosphate transport system protein